MKTSRLAIVLALTTGFAIAPTALAVGASIDAERAAQRVAAAEQESSPTAKAYAVDVPGLRADSASVPVAEVERAMNRRGHLVAVASKSGEEQVCRRESVNGGHVFFCSTRSFEQSLIGGAL